MSDSAATPVARRALWRGRAVALAVVLALAATAWLAVIQPTMRYIATNSVELANQEAALRDLSSEAPHADALQARLAELESNEARLRVMLPPEAATESLASRVRAKADTAAVKLESVEILAGAQTGTSIRTASVRVHILGTMATVQAFLHAVESDDSALVVNNLYLRARSHAGGFPEFTLDLQCDVSGVFQVPSTTIQARAP